MSQKKRRTVLTGFEMSLLVRMKERFDKSFFREEKQGSIQDSSRSEEAEKLENYNC